MIGPPAVIKQKAVTEERSWICEGSFAHTKEGTGEEDASDRLQNVSLNSGIASRRNQNNVVVMPRIVLATPSIEKK